VKSGRQKGGQALSQRVDHPMGHVLAAGAELERRNNLGARINRHPQPLHLCLAAQSRSQFVHLHVRELEVAEGAFVQELRVRARTRQPPRDGRLTGTEDPLGGGSVQPFSQCEIRTMATCCEGVFRRYMGVSRLEVNVARHA
jgi:hypothetical protein